MRCRTWRAGCNLGCVATRMSFGVGISRPNQQVERCGVMKGLNVDHPMRPGEGLGDGKPEHNKIINET